jgi:hypothetical protein
MKPLGTTLFISAVISLNRPLDALREKKAGANGIF